MSKPNEKSHLTNQNKEAYIKEIQESSISNIDYFKIDNYSNVTAVVNNIANFHKAEVLETEFKDNTLFVRCDMQFVTDKSLLTSDFYEVLKYNGPFRSIIVYN